MWTLCKFTDGRFHTGLRFLISYTRASVLYVSFRYCKWDNVNDPRSVYYLGNYYNTLFKNVQAVYTTF
jgi:hypothetical protein